MVGGRTGVLKVKTKVFVSFNSVSFNSESFDSSYSLRFHLIQNVFLTATPQVGATDYPPIQ